MPVDPSQALLSWYAVDKRDLPWRYRSGETPDPYRVWLSEIMLQQTTVAAVKPYFADFTARWPDVGTLAAADEGEVMGAWAGLGYYARARNLIACARVVARRGAFPATAAELLQLPGIGAYTSAAIAAIAFWIGVRSDAPLAAVGGAVLVSIVLSILDQIDALDPWRNAFPGHYATAWQDLIAPSPVWGDVVHGSLWALMWTILFVIALRTRNERFHALFALLAVISLLIYPVTNFDTVQRAPPAAAVNG